MCNSMRFFRIKSLLVVVQMQKCEAEVQGESVYKRCLEKYSGLTVSEQLFVILSTTERDRSISHILRQ
jgi:hypothetical protein